jgi:hypothetical protein
MAWQRRDEDDEDAEVDAQVAAFVVAEHILAAFKKG